MRLVPIAAALLMLPPTLGAAKAQTPAHPSAVSNGSGRPLAAVLIERMCSSTLRPAPPPAPVRRAFA